MPKTPAKPSYSLVGDLHGMQGVSGSSPLGSIFFLPVLYYFIGSLIINFPISYQSENFTYTLSIYDAFLFQEINENLLALGCFLYSINLARKIENLKN